MPYGKVLLKAYLGAFFMPKGRVFAVKFGIVLEGNSIPYSESSFCFEAVGFVSDSSLSGISESESVS